MADTPPQFDADVARALLALAQSERPPGGPCPAPATIAQWQDGVLAETQAAALLAHVAHCQRCLNLWSGLLETLGVVDEPVAVPVQQRRPSWRTPALVAATLAVVAVAGMLLRYVPGGAPGLPAYSLSLADRMGQRGGAEPADAVFQFGPGDTFQLNLRAATAVTDALEVRAYVDPGSGPLPLVAPPARIATSGGAQIAGTVGTDVQLPGGSSTLVVVIGRQGRLPDVTDIMATLKATGHVTERNWSAWALVLEVSEGEPP